MRLHAKLVLGACPIAEEKRKIIINYKCANERHGHDIYRHGHYKVIATKYRQWTLLVII